MTLRTFDQPWALLAAAHMRPGSLCPSRGMPPDRNSIDVAAKHRGDFCLLDATGDDATKRAGLPCRDSR